MGSYNSSTTSARLRLRQLHSGVCRRLGAAKALAKLADKLADERQLASEYLLEALLAALASLQLAEADARGTGTRAQLAEAIKVRFACSTYLIDRLIAAAFRRSTT